MPEQVEPHYVVHVRVEKVLTTKIPGIKIVDTGDKRIVEDVVNITKKSDNLVHAVDFVKGVLELSLDTDN